MDECRLFFTLFNAEKERLPSVFATGKVRYIRRIIATFKKISIKQFFSNMTAVLAQYLSSSQDQEMNVNEKQSAQLLKEGRYPNRLRILQQLTCSVFCITDSPSV